MKKNVLVDIKGIEIIDGEKEVTQILTTGEFYEKNNIYYIVYDEILEENKEPLKTTLKVKGTQTVTLTRFGQDRSQLIVENGKRHQCFYSTQYGGITVGIMGQKITNSLCEKGGEIAFGYTLDINTNLSSEHEVHVQIKEC